MQLKSVPTEFKATPEGEFEGYASVFGNRDSYGDVVVPGAFTRTIANDRGRVKVLYQHDPSQPIGIPIEMREDDRGLLVRARIADTTLGRDTLALMRAGVITELSIGYDAVREEYDNESSERKLTEIKLWEFSPVTWAANDLARITAVKQASDLDAVLDRLERIQWAKGRLESPRLRAKAEAAITTLTTLLNGEPIVAAPPGTPPTIEPDSDPVHSVLDTLTALNTKLHAATIAHELRAFGETLRSTNGRA